MSQNTLFPKISLSYEQLEKEASKVLSPEAYDWIASGAGAGDTIRANREAFYQWRLRPRVLRDVSNCNISTTVLGTQLPAPFLLAPVANLPRFCEDGTKKAFRAAAAAKIPPVVATGTSLTIEEVATLMNNSPRWFQIYPGKDMEIMMSLASRAENSGYSAIVITIDEPVIGWREKMLSHISSTNTMAISAEGGSVNYLSDPVFRKHLERPPEEDYAAAIAKWRELSRSPRFTWSEVDLIRKSTRLPLLLKGITHPDDARVAIEHGVNGIIVSNHGGRSLDGAISTLDALVTIVDEVQRQASVLMDGGIHRGIDVLKAIAIGADAVLVGRLYLYALSVAGEEGVLATIRNLITEMENELRVLGCKELHNLDRSYITRDPCIRSARSEYPSRTQPHP